MSHIRVLHHVRNFFALSIEKSKLRVYSSNIERLLSRKVGQNFADNETWFRDLGYISWSAYIEVVLHVCTYILEKIYTADTLSFRCDNVCVSVHESSEQLPLLRGSLLPVARRCNFFHRRFERRSLKKFENEMLRVWYLTKESVWVHLHEHFIDFLAPLLCSSCATSIARCVGLGVWEFRRRIWSYHYFYVSQSSVENFYIWLPRANRAKICSRSFFFAIFSRIFFKRHDDV